MPTPPRGGPQLVPPPLRVPLVVAPSFRRPVPVVAVDTGSPRRETVGRPEGARVGARVGPSSPSMG